MKKIWSQEAWKDYLYWQENDKNILKRINKLILDIERNGYDCIGKPEALKGNLSGLYSVRIDGKNRLVFRISNGAIEIAQCKTHYGDK
ncbi:Txe/YoeB family addiction module toxin [Campylobacter sp.]|jgi:addiction module toxin, txe/yoeB family|uniref:Txe/YoeB family addiction module toxin n=1 Tax=Campylobacter sp. TaxID=205 RepID=UPI000F10FFC1|nr:Txe/YoeB family addiction module toxin [Campylobacter sp.]RKV93006.1 MAG: Txe/YoeB family addiction module toxin [Campylobacter sp.]